MPQGMRVRVPPRALFSSFLQKTSYPYGEKFFVLWKENNAPKRILFGARKLEMVLVVCGRKKMVPGKEFFPER